MPSKLETKKFRVGIEFRQLSTRLERLGVSLSIEEPTGSLISTNKACDRYLNLYEAVNEGFDRILSHKKGKDNCKQERRNVMSSTLETKQNKVRTEWELLKEKYKSINLSFWVTQKLIDSRICTEDGCDMLLNQFKNLDHGLDRDFCK